MTNVICITFAWLETTKGAATFFSIEGKGGESSASVPRT